jgi:hypothetical protein
MGEKFMILPPIFDKLKNPKIIMDKCSFYHHSFQNAWKNMKIGEKNNFNPFNPPLNPKKVRFF